MVESRAEWTERGAVTKFMDEGVLVRPSEVIFEVTEAVEGGYDARALGYDIFTQGDDWKELKEMVKDAVLCHFDDEDMPRIIRLRLVKDEVLAV